MPSPGFWPGLLLLFSGTVVALATKTALLQCSTNSRGVERHFMKPWTITLATFVGLAMCWIPPAFHYIQRRFRSKKCEDEDLEFVGDLEPPRTKDYIFLAVPAVLQLLGVTFSTVGLMWTALSMFQMLRASLLVFGALFSVVFLRRQLFSFHVAGIILCLLGIGAVGGAGMMQSVKAPSNSFPVNMCKDDGQTHWHHQAWSREMSGLLMTLLGQFVIAAQFSIEESFLRSVRMAPLHLCGVEGLWGLFIMGAIVCPALMLTSAQWAFRALPTFGSLPLLLHENFWDAWTQISNSPWLAAAMATLTIGVATSNAAGVAVTQYTSSMHRVVVEACRILLVWSVDLGMYYLVGKAYPAVVAYMPAEMWGPWSFFQAVGLALLVGGMLVYNRIVDLPCLRYPSKWTLREHRDAGTLPPAGVVDSVWHLGDAGDRIRLGYYGRIGVGSNGRRCVRFRPGCTIINVDEDEQSQLLPPVDSSQTRQSKPAGRWHQYANNRHTPGAALGDGVSNNDTSITQHSRELPSADMSLNTYAADTNV